MPWLRNALMHLHVVFPHIEGHVRHVQKIIGEVLFDQISLVSATDNKVIDPVLRIDFENVPKDRPAANFNHGLGTRTGFFTEPSSLPASQNNCFHSSFLASFGERTLWLITAEFVLRSCSVANRVHHPLLDLCMLTLRNVDDEKAEHLRRQILDLSTEYFAEAFPVAEFKPGQSPVPISGKVIDGGDLSSVIDSALDCWFTTGRFAEEFERRLARFVGVRCASLVNSGSSANLLAVSALTSPKLGDRRLKPGDEVITVAAGFPTTVNPDLFKIVSCRSSSTLRCRATRST